MGMARDYTKLILGEVFKSWLFVKIKNTVKPTTFERYEGIYRLYIKISPLYIIKLKDLKGLDIQRYYNELHDEGKSTNIIRNLNKLLKSFFNYAVAEGYLSKNYCIGKSLTIPEDNLIDEDKEEDIVALTKDEQLKFINTLGKHRLKALFLMDLGTGLRQGEIVALKWPDIDMDKRTVSIKKTLKNVTIIDGDKRTYKLIEQTPKTKNSIRTVPLPKNLIPLLEEHAERQKNEIAAAGDIYMNNNYVFCTEIGTPIDPRNLRRSFARLLKKAGISHKKFHSLRHTYATRLFEKGVPLKTVQILLGHSNISITANIYTHVMPEEKLKAVDKIDDLLKI